MCLKPEITIPRSALSLRGLVRHGSSLSVFGTNRLGSSISILDCLYIGACRSLGAVAIHHYGSYKPYFSIRSMGKQGSTLSIFGCTLLGSAISTLDYMSFGSSVSLRSMLRLGSSMSVGTHSICPRMIDHDPLFCDDIPLWRGTPPQHFFWMICSVSCVSRTNTQQLLNITKLPNT